MRCFYVAGVVIITVWLVSVSDASAGAMMGGMMDNGKMCGMMGKAPTRGIAPKDLPNPDSKSATTFARICSRCHALPSPKRHTADRWKELVERMERQMRGEGRMGMGMMGGMMGRRMKAMSPQEKEMIIQYLQSNGLRPLDKSSVADMDHPGYVEFKEFCSQCHDLPDPSIHTSREWPQVVEEMVGQMKEASLKTPDAYEEKVLLEFLKGAVRD
ncbi:MAG: hypothetical protein OEZ32_08780 [Nitrospinota bacterium]|nr:hypothetical protein [Nitrospinota bacterium]